VASQTTDAGARRRETQQAVGRQLPLESCIGPHRLASGTEAHRIGYPMGPDHRATVATHRPLRLAAASAA